MKLKDLDYFRTKDNIFFLVKGYYHPPKRVFAYPVFWPDEKGDRLHPFLKKRFKKNTSDIDNQSIFKMHPHYKHNLIPYNIPLVPLKEIVEIYQPQNKIRDFLQNEKNTIWIKIFKAINEISKVPKKDIGIFGSYLINLSQNTQNKQIKDIDFVIYGIKNYIKLKNKFDDLLKFLKYRHISKRHIAYHKKKFGSKFNPEINSFEKTLSRKWSAIQIKKGLLSTIRFVYKNNEIPPNPIMTAPRNKIQIIGQVINDFGTNFMPRTFLMKKNNKIYQIVTYFWGFQEAVREKDQVLITGDLHKDNQTISIDSIDHGIRILN